MAATLPHPGLPQDIVSRQVKAPTGLHGLFRRRLRYRSRLVAAMLAVNLPLMVGLARLRPTQWFTFAQAGIRFPPLGRSVRTGNTHSGS